MGFPIDVSAEGAVHLGNDVVCDGFYFGAKVRVQTHVHTDHMSDFDRSKGFHDVVMTAATRDLLVAERNADLPYRDNIIALKVADSVTVQKSVVQLLPNGHMLGSAQVCVETEEGRLGYSGDFAWPLDQVFKVDALVVDSTYGNPEKVREYDEARAESRFLELVSDELRRGRVT